MISSKKQGKLPVFLSDYFHKSGHFVGSGAERPLEALRFATYTVGLSSDITYTRIAFFNPWRS
jgi:hypothetical protein